MRDRRIKDDFWPPELATFDEDYWAKRSTVPQDDYTPHQAAVWRSIFATRAHYDERQKWAREHGGNVLGEVLALAAAKRDLLDQLLREIPA